MPKKQRVTATHAMACFPAKDARGRGGRGTFLPETGQTGTRKLPQKNRCSMADGGHERSNLGRTKGMAVKEPEATCMIIGAYGQASGLRLPQPFLL